MRRSFPFAVGLSIATLLAFAAAAQSGDARERLINLDMLLISKDVCGFEVSDAQQDAIAGESDLLIQQLNMSDKDGDQLYAQLQDEMTRQKPEGLCAPKGTWAKNFAKLLAGLPVAAPQ